MICVILISFTSFLYAGDSTYEYDRSITWVKDNSSITFEGAVNTSSGIKYCENIELKMDSGVDGVRIVYPVYEKVEKEYLDSIRYKYENLADTITLKTNVSTRRKIKYLDLSFVPFIKKGSEYFRIVSFTFEIKEKQILLRSTLRSSEGSKAGYAASSVLSSGKWIKISVDESGLYKLTYNKIKSLGIDPEKVQIYGYGGSLLSEDFSKKDYSDDLPEVRVLKYCGPDGKFGSGDFILFYAKGPVSWTLNSSGYFDRTRNFYSNKGYYFIGERNGGTLVADALECPDSPDEEVNTYTDHLLHEKERINIGQISSGEGTGRIFFGEDFVSSNDQDFIFDVPDADTTAYAVLKVPFVAKNTNSSNCYVSVNGRSLTSMYFSSVNVKSTHTYGSMKTAVSSFLPKNRNDINIRYSYITSSYYNLAYLDYISLNIKRYLNIDGKNYFCFRNPDIVKSGNVAEFNILGADANTSVIDITDACNMKIIKGSLNGIGYKFTDNADKLKEYVCVDLKGDFSEPDIVGSVNNQNIHGVNKVDMVIISPEKFYKYASEIASVHNEYDGLSTLIVTPEQVYNEFSSGTPDATAYRRMMKLFYDRAASESDMPKYLLLFGGGVYDNRMLTSAVSVSSKSNYILTYQSKESISGTSSYVTDDYFGFLDDDEGANLPSAKIDIGIGRFPVYNTIQAEETTNKVVSYIKNGKKGPWKNRLLFLADDGNANTHVTLAEDMASNVESRYPGFMVNRVYIDAYQRVTTASGPTVPDATARFQELLNDGLLMLNYSGHGSTTAWADEGLLTNSFVNNLTNSALPLWVTATCDFTRFDAPETSGGELAFLNPNGGAVALFTTTRVVYSSQNSLINRAFMNNIFSKKDGKRYSLGKVMELTKSSSSLNGDANKLNFTLIGDPAMSLSYPSYYAKITAVNNDTLLGGVDTLRIFDEVNIEGEIYDENGNFDKTFNGIVYPTVMDAKTSVTTQGYNNDPYTYSEYSKKIFTGKDSVRNGKFSFKFKVPKDISYSSVHGSINIYACETGVENANEAQGHYGDIVFAGKNTITEKDSIGPDISLYLNDYNFRSGGTVDEMPVFIADISDESGLNTAGSGIGHDIKLIVDGDEKQSYNLNNYFAFDAGSYTSGVVKYIMPEMPEGRHSLSFKTWDLFNNSSSASLDFIVKKGYSAEIRDFRCAVNGDAVYFRFNHNRPVKFEHIDIEIYDIFGNRIWRKETNMETEDVVSDVYVWDRLSSSGNPVACGVYICRITITDKNGASSDISKKIILTPQ